MQAEEAMNIIEVLQSMDKQDLNNTNCRSFFISRYHPQYCGYQLLVRVVCLLDAVVVIAEGAAEHLL